MAGQLIGSPSGMRVQPEMGVAAYKTYQVAVPLTGWVRRRATCEEVACPAYHNGWATTVDETTDLGQWQGGYIRREAGRAFTEEKTPDGLTVFTFGPGQSCFSTADHVKAERRDDTPELFIVRDGDWRGNPTGNGRRHVNGADWVEDFGEHLQCIEQQIEGG
jgi:hypothetical protein